MAETMQEGRRTSGRGWRIAAWMTVAGLLLAPFVAMQFTDAVAWTPSDFVFAGVMLIGPGLVFELIVGRTRDWAARAGFALALIAAVLIVWTTGAVGIIGSEANGANLMLAAVLAAGLVGAGIARFRPGGMALAMTATGGVQIAVGVFAVVRGLGAEAPMWPWDIAGATLVFALMWLTAAGLFLMSARRARPGA